MLQCGSEPYHVNPRSIFLCDHQEWFRHGRRKQWITIMAPIHHNPAQKIVLPSRKHTKTYEKTQCLIVKSTISMGHVQ